MAVLKISDFGITNRKILKEKTEKQSGEQLFFRSLLTKDLVNPLHFMLTERLLSSRVPETFTVRIPLLLFCNVYTSIGSSVSL